MSIAFRSLLLSTLFAVQVPALAAPPKNIVPPEMLAATGEQRTVQVFVPQAEIKADIVDSKVAMAAGGGLLMAMIDAGVNSSRAKKAEAAVQPVREALTGYDADALALATTNAALTGQTWLGAQPAQLSKDNTVPAKMAVLDATSTPQTVFIEFEYGLSPDFSAVVVSASIQIASREVPAKKKPDARVIPRNLLYVQSVRSVQVLPDPDKEATVNAGRWAEGDAALARKSLDAAFARVGELIPRALQVSAEDQAAWKKVKGNTALGGHSGKLVEESDGETLLFDGSLISVRTIARP